MFYLFHLLFFLDFPGIFYIFAITFGVGYGGETGGFPILNRKYYGHAPMGGAHGFQMFGHPERYHAEASEDAWKKVLDFLKRNLI